MSTTAYQIIAVDFDGTLCYGNWPELGEPNRPLIEYLINQKRSGNKLILWTCRAGEALEKAVSWCRDHDLTFDAVNDNLPEIIEMYGNNSRKITCDYYIDDKAVLPQLLNVMLTEVCINTMISEYYGAVVYRLSRKRKEIYVL